jgi:uncharacterized protein (TIGR02266 family)
MSEEHRKQPRLDPLVIRVDVNDGQQTQTAYLTNLSEGGAFLATEDLLPVGRQVALQIHLPWGLGALKTEATVMWRTYEAGPRARRLPSGLGVAFVDLSAAGKGKIRQYMQRFHQLVAQIEAQPS